jgi:hypothetical protein
LQQAERDMRQTLFAFTIAALAATGCADDMLGNEGFEIDCDGQPCDWVVVEGNPDFSGSWHPSDPGADLSAPGRIVIEQWTAPFEIDSRELLLEAALVREPSASLRFEIDWYASGEGAGATYWDRSPVLLDSRGFDVGRSGVFLLDELISAPSLEASGAVIRVVKDGTGQAILDELFLSIPVFLP